MQTFRRIKRYKAKEPYETVAWIRNILAERDIFLSESTRFTEEADVVSCRIWLSDDELNIADFGTNGKGMNARYALASAYGEFMERLQNLQLFGDYAENAYHNGLTQFMAAPDEVMMDAAESLKQGGEVLTELMRLGEEKKAELASETDGSRMPAVPYHDVFNERDVLLPNKTVKMVTGSNGMAAGNTYKEAVIQGLSEIYERAAVMQAYRDNPKIMQLHPESFKEYSIYDKLEKLRMYGYSYKILDLSMGKDYPVIGLRVEIQGNVAFKAGADPCPVTALERCLTEMFQGDPAEINRNFHRNCCAPFPGADERTRRMISDAEIAYHVDGSGQIAQCLFYPSDEYNENFAGTDAESEESDYDYMVALTRRLGYGLYIRDCSFLGFPSYHIVVPELSNYDLVYDQGDEIFRWSFEPTRFRKDICTQKVADIINSVFAGSGPE